MRCRDHADGTADATTRHLLECVAKIGMPVAHADMDRQRMPASLHLLCERIRLAHGELGQRRDTAEQLIVMRDLFDAGRGDPPSAQDVRQERTDVIWPLRSAEGDDKDSIERVWHSDPDPFRIIAV